jgi:hypothetical protein
VIVEVILVLAFTGLNLSPVLRFGGVSFYVEPEARILLDYKCSSSQTTVTAGTTTPLIYKICKDKKGHKDAYIDSKRESETEEFACQAKDSGSGKRHAALIYTSTTCL